MHAQKYAKKLNITLPAAAGLDRGGLVGIANITGCHTVSQSPWFEGPYGYALEGAVAFDRCIPWKGMQGFFPVQLPSDAVACLPAHVKHWFDRSDTSTGTKEVAQ